MARRQEVEALRRQLAEVNATAKQLQNIKDEFNHDVHSVRRLENVNSVADFLRLLDRRDLLNEQALQRVSRIVDFVSEAPSEEVYTVQDGVQQIHDLIASRIGRDWKNFARKLHVLESEIDRYDDIFKKKSCFATLRVLLKFRTGRFVNNDEWLYNIRRALDYANRNDIWESVEDLVVRLGGAGALHL